jgi:hypothetical protein
VGPPSQGSRERETSEVAAQAESEKTSASRPAHQARGDPPPVMPHSQLCGPDVAGLEAAETEDRDPVGLPDGTEIAELGSAGGMGREQHHD